MTHIVCLGLNHRSAPVYIRERIAEVPDAINDGAGSLTELLTLSTCNRAETYAVCEDTDAFAEWLTEQWVRGHRLSCSELRQHTYRLAGREAVDHLMRVAAGLDSQIIGETEVLGQVTAAYQSAIADRTAGPILSALFRAAIHAGKRARSETGISNGTASISSVAVQLAKQVFGDLSASHVLLIGAGDMIELAAQVLADEGVPGSYVYSRTHSRATELAYRWNGQAVEFAQLAGTLDQVDIVISSTSASDLVLGYKAIAAAMLARQGRPLFFIDIAVPRDIDPSAAEIPGVHLYNIDDLRVIIDQNMDARRSEIVEVEAIIKSESSDFWRWLRSLAVVPTIADLRKEFDDVRQVELQRLLAKLNDVPLSQQEIISEFSTRLINKLLHRPSVLLKDEAVKGDGIGLAAVVRQLFGLEAKDRD